MLRTRIEKGYRVTIPEPLRPTLHEGEELLVSMDESGRIVLIPSERALQILERTAGMWQGRTDIPADGIHYVQEQRSARRLRDLGILP